MSSRFSMVYNEKVAEIPKKLQKVRDSKAKITRY